MSGFSTAPASPAHISLLWHALSMRRQQPLLGLVTDPSLPAAHDFRTEAQQQASGTQRGPPPHPRSRTASAERRRAVPHAYAGWQRHRRQQCGLQTPRASSPLSCGEATPAVQPSGPHPGPEMPPHADSSPRAAATQIERDGVEADERRVPDESLRRALADCWIVPPHNTQGRPMLCVASGTSDSTLSSACSRTFRRAVATEWGRDHFEERQQLFRSLAASASVSTARGGEAGASLSSSGAPPSVSAL